MTNVSRECCNHARESSNINLNQETVDQLLRDHVDFLDTCPKECLLMSAKLLRICARPPTQSSDHRTSRRTPA
ncbi:hypothetical protein C8R48DRAFT_718649 [Suillus tomentosus]|nr:hypothetical protein C8R48DRAFT_718649 [Suillus tomentosus]